MRPWPKNKIPEWVRGLRSGPLRSYLISLFRPRSRTERLIDMAAP